MTVEEIVKKLDLEVISSGNMAADIDGCYCSDLLSHCMSNIKSGNIWVTVQTNINIAAIAVLTEPSCIIIAQGMNVDETVAKKAANENVTILRSNLPAYEICTSIGNLI